MNKRLLDILNGEKHKTQIESIVEIIDTVFQESNYYSVLHQNIKRNFGNMQYSNTLTEEQKIDSIQQSLQLYLHNYIINCVIINKNQIVITLSRQEFYYEHILEI